MGRIEEGSRTIRLEDEVEVDEGAEGRETGFNWNIRLVGKTCDVTVHFRRGEERRRRGKEVDQRDSRVWR